MSKPLFPTPLTHQVLLNAIHRRKPFTIRLGWSKGEVYTPQYDKSTPLKVGTLVVIYWKGYYNIAIVNRGNTVNKMVRVQHIPKKQDIQAEQSLPSQMINWYNVKARLIRRGS